MSSDKASFSLFTFIFLGVLMCSDAGYVNAATYDGTPPSVPSLVSAVSQNSPSLRIVISWSASTDNVKVTRYNMYKNGTFLTTPSGVATTYIDTSVAAGQSYTYSVQAGDGDGNNSPQSDTVQIVALSGEASHIVTANVETTKILTPPSIPPMTSVYTSSGVHKDTPLADHPERVSLTASEDKMEISWKNPTNNSFKSVRVIKKETSFPLSVTDGKVICDSIQVILCIDRDVVKNKTYYYGVYATDQSYIASKIINVSGILLEKKTEVIAPQKSTSQSFGSTQVVSSEVRPRGSVNSSTTTTKNIFTKTLQVGSVGQEVLLLQKFLNTHGFTITTSGAGSPGNEITTFGRATQKSLQAYQCQRNIICSGSPIETGYGMVGKATRMNLNKEL